MLRWILSVMIGPGAPVFIEQALKGADGLPSSTRLIGLCSFAVCVAYSAACLAIGWREVHTAGLMIWITLTASCLGISVYGARSYWQSHKPDAEPK